jgi:hypothetical protein
MDILRLGKTTRCKEAARRARNVRSELSRHLVAVHVGEPEVTDDHIGPDRPDEVHTGAAVLGGSYLATLQAEGLRQQVPHVRLVLDQDDPEISKRRRRLLVTGNGRRTRGRRQRHGELGPAPGALAPHRHRTPVRLDEPLHQGQTEAEPTVGT